MEDIDTIQSAYTYLILYIWLTTEAKHVFCHKIVYTRALIINVFPKAIEKIKASKAYKDFGIKLY